MTRNELTTFTVEIERDLTSRPITHKNAVVTYQKGDLFCVLLLEDGGKYKAVKYPVDSIFRITEYD